MKRFVAAAWLLVPAVAAAVPRTAGVVDARPLDSDPAARAAAEEALKGRPDLALVTDPALRSALVGVVDSARIPRRDAGCTGDDELVGWLALAPLDEVRGPVTRLLARRLICADDAKDRGTALAAARRLRALGTDGGVATSVWDRYPHVDATVDVLRQPLTVTTDPAGASITIDLAPAAGPQTVVSSGQRLVAASLGERAAATVVTMKEDRAAQVALTLPAVDERFAPVRAAVRALREGKGDVLAVTKAATIDVVVVLHDDGAQAYARDGEVLRPLGTARLGDGPALAALLPAFGPAPSQKPVAAAKPDGGGRSVWTYIIAAGAGAAAVGLVVLASGSGSSTQRIEVKWP